MLRKNSIIRYIKRKFPRTKVIEEGEWDKVYKVAKRQLQNRYVSFISIKLKKKIEKYFNVVKYEVKSSDDYTDAVIMLERNIQIVISSVYSFITYKASVAHSKYSYMSGIDISSQIKTEIDEQSIQKFQLLMESHNECPITNITMDGDDIKFIYKKSATEEVALKIDKNNKWYSSTIKFDSGDLSNPNTPI